MKKIIACFLIFCFVAVNAAPIRFDYLFEDTITGARAEGYIVFEETLLVNPTGSNRVVEGGGGGPGVYAIPGPEVLDLAVTVSGSVPSNGNYVMSDFSQVVFFTNGATLNLNTELVGQPTDNDPWGTLAGGSAGDFNLFSNNSLTFYPPEVDSGEGGTNTPNGCIHFTLCTPADAMFLVSMRGTPVVVTPVPALSTWSIIMLIFSSMLMGGLYFRKQ